MKSMNSKSMGHVREIDKNGRIVIPKELRDMLNVQDNDKYEITVEGEDIILRKFSVKCIFCGSKENLKCFNGKKICADCASKISELQRGKSW